MDQLGDLNKSYVNTLKDRVKKSHVYQPHQSTGLLLAEILGDKEHKSLYMRLAKTHNSAELVRIAKDIAERKSVENKGAYFMKLLQERRRNDDPKSKPKASLF
ncbi:MAG: hypothetical protein KGI60_00395 [Patescibacteria group bacterium]|nr:hypothetical protein [Patescibacteria group bacterium]